MDMAERDKIIIEICQALKDEADGVINNTKRASEAFAKLDKNNSKTDLAIYRVFGSNSIDGIEHIHSLTIALTQIVEDAGKNH